ncbi:hypothetical protein ACIRPT_23585 [Streptomyces sp. NPDC101227]|uniref:hypothetical protein n=1 Tax=Streptomyces sp. NPDC101227 TaxID=3366136 RepID=UPI0038236780
MDSMGGEIWTGDNGPLTGERTVRDGGTDAGRVLCPRSVAGWARLAADVIAPFSVRRIPMGAPQDHDSRMSNLSGIVNDHPYGHPHEDLIVEAARLPARPGGRDPRDAGMRSHSARTAQGGKPVRERAINLLQAANLPTTSP